MCEVLFVILLKTVCHNQWTECQSLVRRGLGSPA